MNRRNICALSLQVPTSVHFWADALEGMVKDEHRPVLIPPSCVWDLGKANISLQISTNSGLIGLYKVDLYTSLF